MRAIVAAVLCVAFYIHSEDKPIESNWQLRKITLKSGGVMQGLVLDEPGQLVYIDDGGTKLDFARSSIKSIETLSGDDSAKLNDEINTRRHRKTDKEIAAMRKPVDEMIENERLAAEARAKSPILQLLYIGEFERKALAQNLRDTIKADKDKGGVWLHEKLSILNDMRDRYFPQVEFVAGSRGILKNDVERDAAGKARHVAPIAEVFQIVDESNMLCKARGQLLWVRTSTRGLVDGDGQHVALPGILECLGTTQYKTLFGTRTVYLLREVPP